MTSFVFQKKTQQALDRTWSSGAHGIVLAGPVGVGLSGAAQYCIAKFQGAHAVWVRPEKDKATDYEKGSIAVDRIRELYDVLKTRDPNGRIVVIDAAERMAVPAQNAFLKLLEEPPQGVRFILLTHTPGSLLPTIRSRVQRIDVAPISTKESKAFIERFGVVDAKKQAQLLFMADGLPALLTTLLEDEELFEGRAEIVRDARTYISGNAYQRLVIAQKYKDNRTGALQLMEDSMLQLRRAAGQSGDSAPLERLDSLMGAYDSIRQNGNVRLQLAAAVVV